LMSGNKAFIITFSIFFLSTVAVIFGLKYFINKKVKADIVPEKKMIIRKPAVAGSFYPADSEELNSQISGFFDQAKMLDTESNLRILIVPHAGLEYSGQTAAWGFRQVEDKKYTRVILLGVSHKNWFDYAAVYNEGKWETPLGETPIDEELATALLGNKTVADTVSHKEEHSLEVELVLLQKILSNFKIVPILLGQVSDKVIDDLAGKISQNMDENTLLVVSSDLSHYPSWSVANEVDGETIKAIVSGNKSTFERKIGDLESKNYPSLDTCACGQQAISVALKIAEILSIEDFRKIHYENSGDISGDKSRVVGYAAIGAWQESGQDILGEQAKKEALSIARRTLEEYLKTNKVLKIIPREKVLEKFLGAFVTLQKAGQLRGCIGLFEPEMPLYKVIQEMAIAAATEDGRFLPVAEKELKEVNIEISIMTPKKKINDWREIQPGKQGVVIQKGPNSGTFLPQVATETGWSKEEFLGQLCTQKAGLPNDCYKDPLVSLFVFEAQVFAED